MRWLVRTGSLCPAIAYWRMALQLALEQIEVPLGKDVNHIEEGEVPLLGHPSLNVLERGTDLVGIDLLLWFISDDIRLDSHPIIEVFTIRMVFPDPRTPSEASALDRSGGNESPRIADVEDYTVARDHLCGFSSVSIVDADHIETSFSSNVIVLK